MACMSPFRPGFAVPYGAASGAESHGPTTCHLAADDAVSAVSDESGWTEASSQSSVSSASSRSTAFRTDRSVGPPACLHAVHFPHDGELLDCAETAPGLAAVSAATSPVLQWAQSSERLVNRSFARPAWTSDMRRLDGGRMTLSTLPVFTPIQLRRSDYYCVPSVAKLRQMPLGSLSQVVGFKIGREGIGLLEFLDPVDLRPHTVLDDAVQFERGFVQLSRKRPFLSAARGSALGIASSTGTDIDGTCPVRARVTLSGCFPGAAFRSAQQYIRHLQSVTSAWGGQFEHYDADIGQWRFLLSDVRSLTR